MNVKVLGVIPARYSSTRFPGKPLAIIDGKSMIQRVYEQAKLCPGISHLIVATDDSSIENHVELFGGKVILTSTHHQSGTERCSEVCELLSSKGQDFDVIINIQGDEPFIHPGQIEQVAGCFGTLETTIASLMKKITTAEELHNPNIVKVVADNNGKALYFSRAAIPYLRDREPGQWIDHQSFYKHVGIYGYRTDILMRIVKLPPSVHETAESLEQLRWLDSGFEIKMEETFFESVSVDTPADLLKLTNRH